MKISAMATLHLSKDMAVWCRKVHIDLLVVEWFIAL